MKAMWFFYVITVLYVSQMPAWIFSKRKEIRRWKDSEGGDGKSERESGWNINRFRFCNFPLTVQQASNLPQLSLSLSCVLSPVLRVMVFISTLTPVFVAILCVIIAFIFKTQRRSESSSAQESSTGGGRGSEARPWVDEDLQDDTDISGRENGTNQTDSCRLFALTYWQPRTALQHVWILTFFIFFFLIVLINSSHMNESSLWLGSFRWTDSHFQTAVCLDIP